MGCPLLEFRAMELLAKETIRKFRTVQTEGERDAGTTEGKPDLQVGNCSRREGLTPDN